MTWQQELEKQASEAAQKNTIGPMSEQANKAHNINLQLAQLQPLLQQLPPGGGLVGKLLDEHSDLAPILSTAGVITQPQADAVRLVNGLVAGISSEMKPTGLGALREYEWDAFKSRLPSMMSSTDGQQKALATLMQFNNRIQAESNWMNNYYSRQIPDTQSTTPGATRSAHNVESDNPKLSVQQQMDAALGPVIPRYTGPPSGSAQQQWIDGLAPGSVYYLRKQKVDANKQPLVDAQGRPQETVSQEYKPWQ
jgi:hypothetical protein